jgi:hypothetical protein
MGLGAGCWLKDKQSQDMDLRRNRYEDGNQADACKEKLDKGAKKFNTHGHMA